jgi:hypothetical protein
MPFTITGPAADRVDSRLPSKWFRGPLKTDYSGHSDGPDPATNQNMALSHGKLDRTPTQAEANAPHLWGAFTLFETDVELTTRARIEATDAPPGRKARLLADALGIDGTEAMCRIGLPVAPHSEEYWAAKEEDRPAVNLRLARDIAAKSGGSICATVQEIEAAELVLSNPRASRDKLAYQLAARNGSSVLDEMTFLASLPGEATAVATFNLSRKASEKSVSDSPEQRRAWHAADPKAASAAMAQKYGASAQAWLNRAGRAP